jgi:hypothetical protein
MELPPILDSFSLRQRIVGLDDSQEGLARMTIFKFSASFPRGSGLLGLQSSVIPEAR